MTFEKNIQKALIIFILCSVLSIVMITCYNISCTSLNLLCLDSKDFFQSTINLALGLSVCYFSANELITRDEERIKSEESKKPKIGFDLSLSTYLHEFIEEKDNLDFIETADIFLVIKNIGSSPIYDIKISLIAEPVKKFEHPDMKPGIKELKLPALFSEEFRLFNTKITLNGLEGWNKAICTVECYDEKNTKFDFSYDFKSKQKIIKEYFSKITQRDELEALQTYKKISRRRLNLGDKEL